VCQEETLLGGSVQGNVYCVQRPMFFCRQRKASQPNRRAQDNGRRQRGEARQDVSQVNKRREEHCRNANPPGWRGTVWAALGVGCVVVWREQPRPWSYQDSRPAVRLEDRNSNSNTGDTRSKGGGGVLRTAGRRGRETMAMEGGGW
jgi:hypothetical protein